MNVLIVGLGSIAKKHISAIKIIRPKAQFYALRFSLDANRIEGIQNIFSVSELNTIKVDFAIVSNPTFAHRETIKSLIPFNIP